MYTYIYIHIYIYTYIYTYIHIYIHTYIYTHIYMYTHAHTYLLAYQHTYTHTHTKEGLIHDCSGVTTSMWAVTAFPSRMSGRPCVCMMHVVYCTYVCVNFYLFWYVFVYVFLYIRVCVLFECVVSHVKYANMFNSHMCVCM